MWLEPQRRKGPSLVFPAFRIDGSGSRSCLVSARFVCLARNDSGSYPRRSAIDRDTNPHRPVFRLDGLVALVTGAGRGLGAETAIALADAGAEVLLMSRTPTELEDVAKRIAALGGRATVLPCDVTDGNQVRA